MAKQPAPSVEYFNLVVGGIAPENLGATMAALAKLGLTDVRPELVTEIAAFRKKAQYDTTAEQFITAWTATNPTFAIRDLITHGREQGRTHSSMYAAVFKMVADGTLKKLGPGNYGLPGIKAIAAPKKKGAIGAHAKTGKFDKSGPDVIMSYARRSHGRFSTAKISEIFEAEGRAANSVHASVSKLLKDKLIKRVGEEGSGVYEITAKGQSDRMKKLIAAKANGQDTEAAHG